MKCLLDSNADLNTVKLHWNQGPEDRNPAMLRLKCNIPMSFKPTTTLEVYCVAFSSNCSCDVLTHHVPSPIVNHRATIAVIIVYLIKVGGQRFRHF